MPLIPLMAASGPTVFSGAVTLSATTTLSVSGVRDTSGAVSLSATTTLVSAGIRSTDGATTLAAAAGLTVNGIRTVTGAAATLASTATLTAGAQANFFAVVSLSATSTLSSAGTAVPSGGVNLSVTSSLVAGTAGFFVSVSLTATGVLSVSAGAVLPGAISLAAVGNLSANGIREVSGAVSLNAAAALLSTAILTAFGAVTLAALGVLTTDGVRSAIGTVSLAVTSVLSTDGIRTTSGAVVLAAGGSLTGTGSLPSDSPPTVTAGRSRPVARGSTVVLDVIAAPPASQTISGHTWTIQSGGGSLTSASTATPIYSPPGSGSGLAVIRDTVTASGGGSAFADVTVSYHANVVAAENALTGVARTTWDLPTTALGGVATLQGFCDGFTGDKTQTISFKIAQSDTAGWTGNLYRLGYYGGNGARDYGPLNPTGGQVTTSQVQPTSLDVDPDTTLKSSDCSNWSVNLTWTPPAWVPSGIYILRLNRTGGGASHVMFIVRDDARTADLMFMPADSTWNAYNAFRDMGTTNWLAGNSLYFGTALDQYNADCAHYVSYNRPVVNRQSATSGVTYGAVEWSMFFTGEYGMLRFAERNGIDVKYYGCIDSAGDASGTLLKGNGSTIGGVKAGVFVGHNEYWSNNMRAGWEAFKTVGGNVFSCAGNEVFWRLVGTAPDSAGRPRTWECQKSTINGRGNTRPEWTGTWRDPDGAGKGGNNPENAFTGTIFVVNGPDFRSLIVPKTGGYADQPLWRHTTLPALAGGSSYTSPAQILGFEWDTYAPAGVNTTGANFLGAPHARARYCSTATHVVGGSIVLTDAGDVYSSGTVTHRLVVQPSGNNGGITFGTGTVNWAFGVDNTNTYQGTSVTGNDNTDIVLQQATVNIFTDMGCLPTTIMPGLTQPTAVDWFPAGAVTLTAVATLAADSSAVAISGAVSLTVNKTLTVDAVRTTSGAVSLGVTSSLTASGTLGAVAATSLTAVGVLSVSGVRSINGSIALVTVPVLTVDGVRTTLGNVSLASTSTLSVDGLRATAGAIALSSVGVLTAAGTTIAAGLGATLSATAVLVVAGRLGAFGSVTLSATPVLVVAVSVGVTNGSAALAALGTLSAGGVRVANILIGGVPLVAIGGLNVNGVAGSGGGSNLTVGSTLLVAATAVRLAATQLTALSVLVVIPVGTAFATVTFVVTPTLGVSGVLVRLGSVNLLSAGGLTLAAGGAASAAVALLAAAILSFIDLFPQVSVFASGVWLVVGPGVYRDDQPTPRTTVEPEWTTAGIHTALAWSS